jgi:hypothetical protein
LFSKKVCSTHLRLKVVTKEHIRGLDVAVDDPVLQAPRDADGCLVPRGPFPRSFLRNRIDPFSSHMGYQQSGTVINTNGSISSFSTVQRRC